MPSETISLVLDALRVEELRQVRVRLRVPVLSLKRRRVASRRQSGGAKKRQRGKGKGKREREGGEAGVGREASGKEQAKESEISRSDEGPANT